MGILGDERDVPAFRLAVRDSRDVRFAVTLVLQGIGRSLWRHDTDGMLEYVARMTPFGSRVPATERSSPPLRMELFMAAPLT